MKPNTPSSTARLIARSTVFIARTPRLGHLVPSKATDMSLWFLEATSSRPRQLLWLIEQKWFRALVAFIEALTIPGILLHYIVRKRYLEEVAREGLENGIGQVVVLGAGFDTLALRLCQEFETANFVEVDHPATQEIKAQVLRDRQVLPPNMHLLAVDLSQERLNESLLTCSFYQPKSRTLFVAEGLLMYLEPNKVEELFQFMAKHAAPGSRFAFTFLELQGSGKVNFRHGSSLIDLWLARRGEGFRWGIRRQQLEAYLANQGLSLHEIADEKVLRRRYLMSPPRPHARLAQGEYIGVAQSKAP